ncbi:MAG: cell division protein FtsW [Limisphaerales bacterium]|jgi:cell division protein FtsW
MRLLLSKLKGDKYLWILVLMLSVFSILAVYSSTGTLAYKYHSGNTEYYLFKHFFLLLFGFGLMYVASLVNYKFYSRLAQLLLFISIPLLAYTLIWGTSINDAERWITIPLINLTFQTSDLAKIALILFTARVLSRKQHRIKSFKDAFVPIVLPIVVTCGLIAPADLSSACVLFFTCLMLMFIGRIGMKHIAGLIGTAVVALAFLGLVLASVPEANLPGRMPTWKSRIESFTSGEKAVEPYQVEQARIAIAQGGLLGRGPGNSMQRNFLPHPYSDFIYAIVIEEYGLLGGTILLLLYLAFLYRCIRIVMKTPNPFGALVSVGLGLSLTIQALINMGVTVGLLPVTGLTLPLVSMGGTSIWFTSIAIGIILSVSRDLGMGAENEEELDGTPKLQVV